MGWGGDNVVTVYDDKSKFEIRRRLVSIIPSVLPPPSLDRASCPACWAIGLRAQMDYRPQPDWVRATVGCGYCNTNFYCFSDMLKHFNDNHPGAW